MSRPLTVLLPVRNHARFLRAAVGSILGQSFQDFDLLVVDDASSDGSRELLESLGDPRLRVLRNHEPLGLPATLNRGLRETSSTWVARQDADDVSEPQRLERQLAFLGRRPDLSLLGTEGSMVDEEDRPVGLLRASIEHGTLLWGLLFDNCFVHTSVVFRRDHVLELGGYDASLSRGQDYDLWVRMAACRTVANLAELLVTRRIGMAVSAESEDEYSRPNRGILARHHETTLGAPPSEGEHALLDAFRRGLHREGIPAMLDLHTRLAGAFSRRHPTAVRSRDFRRALARQFARMALARGNRSPSALARVLARGRGTALAGLAEAARGRLWLQRARAKARGVPRS